MKTIDAIAHKGKRVTADKGQPGYTGTLVSLSKINRTWYGNLKCDDGQERGFRCKWLKPWKKPAEGVVTDRIRDAVNKALGFVMEDEVIRQAMLEYGAWHLPTLKIECASLEADLLKCNPEGGLAWRFVHKMKIAIAVRTMI